MRPSVTPCRERLAERGRPRQRRFGAVRIVLRGHWPRPLYSAASGLELAAHPDNTNGFMLRGIHKSLLQLARPRRHGRAARPDRHQLRHLGHRRHFPRLRPVDASPRSAAPKSGSSTFRQIYQDRLQQLGRQIGRPILPDQARALGLDRQMLDQVIAETVLDERARVAAARHRATPRWRAASPRTRTSRASPASSTARGSRRSSARPGFTERASWPSSAATLLRQQLIGTVSGDAVVPKTALEAFNRFQNEQRTIEYVRARPRAGRRHRRSDARGARQIFRGAQGAVPLARIPQGHDRWR